MLFLHLHLHFHFILGVLFHKVLEPCNGVYINIDLDYCIFPFLQPKNCIFIGRITKRGMGRLKVKKREKFEKHEPLRGVLGDLSGRTYKNFFGVIPERLNKSIWTE